MSHQAIGTFQILHGYSVIKCKLCGPEGRHGEAIILCDFNDDLTPKRENITSLFTEEKQQPAPLSAAADEEHPRCPRWEGGNREEARALLCGSCKPTYTHGVGDAVLLGSEDSEARRTQRAWSLGRSMSVVFI